MRVAAWQLAHPACQRPTLPADPTSGRGRGLHAATGPMFKLSVVLSAKSGDAEVKLMENIVIAEKQATLMTSIKSIANSTMPALAVSTLGISFTPYWPKQWGPNAKRCAGLGELCGGAYPACCKVHDCWPPADSTTPCKKIGHAVEEMLFCTKIVAPPSWPQQRGVGIVSPDGLSR